MILIYSSNLNGAVSSNIYRAVDKPRYKLGHSIVIGYLCLAFFGSLSAFIYLVSENKKRRSGQRDHRIAGKTEEEIMELGDHHPEYLYRL